MRHRRVAPVLAMLFFWMAPEPLQTVCAQEKKAKEPIPATRLAVVDIGAKDKVPLAFLDLLTVSFSKQEGIELLERAEVSKLLKEQALNLSLSSPVKNEDAVQAGKLWAVDAFLMLEATRQKERHVVRLRLVDARHGIKLLDSGLVLESDFKEYPEQAQLQAKVAAAKIVGWHRNAKTLPLIGVADFSSEELSRTWDWLGGALTAGIEQSLTLEPGLALVERGKTRTLTEERQLAEGLPEALKASGVLVTGSYKVDRKREEIVVHFLCRRQGTILAEEKVSAPWNNPGILARKVADRIVTRLSKSGGEPSMPPEAEAKLFYEQARTYMQGPNILDADKVLQLAEAALALKPGESEYRFLILRALTKQVLEHFRLREKRIEQKEDPWSPLVSYSLRATLVAEQIVDTEGKGLPASWRSQVIDVFRTYQLWWEYVTKMAPPNAETWESLPEIRGRLRLLYSKAIRSPSLGPTKSHLIGCAVDGAYLWQDNFESAKAFALGILAEGAKQWGNDGVSDDMVLKSLVFPVISIHPPWPDAKDVPSRYEAFLLEVRKHPEVLYRLSAEIACVHYYVRNSQQYGRGKFREHCEAILELVKSDYSGKLAQTEADLAHRALDYYFDDDVKKDREVKRVLRQDVLNSFLDNPKRAPRPAVWLPLLQTHVKSLTESGKREEAIAFLERLTSSWKNRDTVEKSDVVLRLLQELKGKPTSTETASGVGVRAQLIFKTADHGELFKSKGWTPKIVTLMRLVSEPGIEALLCFHSLDGKHSFGLLRLEPKTFQPARLDVFPVEASDLGLGFHSYDDIKYSFNFVRRNKDLYVSFPDVGIFVFPEEGPPILWSEKDGLASNAVSKLDMLGDTLFALVGSTRRESGLMAIDLRTRKSEILLSSKRVADREALDDMRVTSLAADPKNRSLWLGLQGDYHTMHRGGVAVYFPDSGKVIRKFNSALPVLGLRKTGKTLLIHSMEYLASLDLETDKLTILAENQDFDPPGLRTRRMAFTAGGMIGEESDSSGRPMLFRLRAGIRQPLVVTEAYLGVRPDPHTAITDMFTSSKGLFIVARDGVYRSSVETEKICSLRSNPAFLGTSQRLLSVTDLDGIRQMTPISVTKDTIYLIGYGKKDGLRYLQPIRMPLAGGAPLGLGKFVLTSPDLPSETVSSLLFASCLGKDQLFLSMIGEGLISFDLRGGPGKKVEKAQDHVGRSITSMTCLGDRLFFHAMRGPLFSYDLNTEKIEILASNERKDKPWPFDTSSFFFVRHLEADPVRNRLLLLLHHRPKYSTDPAQYPGTASGLWEYDLKTGNFKRHREYYPTVLSWMSRVKEDSLLLGGSTAMVQFDLATDHHRLLWADKSPGPDFPAKDAFYKGDLFVKDRQGPGQMSQTLKKGDWLWTAYPFGRLNLKTGKREVFSTLEERAEAGLSTVEFVEWTGNGDQWLVGDLYNLWLLTPQK